MNFSTATPEDVVRKIEDDPALRALMLILPVFGSVSSMSILGIIHFEMYGGGNPTKRPLMNILTSYASFCIFIIWCTLNAGTLYRMSLGCLDPTFEFIMMAILSVFGPLFISFVQEMCVFKILKVLVPGVIPGPETNRVILARILLMCNFIESIFDYLHSINSGNDGPFFSLMSCTLTKISKLGERDMWYVSKR